MPKYAMLNGNTVANIIVADDKESTEMALGCVLIEFTDDNPVHINWIYHPETGKFIAPVVEEEVVTE